MSIINDGETFMLALEVTDINSGSSQNNTIININQVNGSSFTSIPTEPCTIQHFQSVTGIETEFSRKNIGSWKCLPLQQPLFLGIQSKTSMSSAVIINLMCPQCSAINSSLVKVHILTPRINPGRQDFL